MAPTFFMSNCNEVHDISSWCSAYCRLRSMSYMFSRKQWIADDVPHMSLMQIDSYFEKDLMRSLEIYRHSSLEGNKTIRDDFDAVQHLVNDPLLYIIYYSTTVFLYLAPPASECNTTQPSQTSIPPSFSLISFLMPLRPLKLLIPVTLPAPLACSCGMTKAQLTVFFRFIFFLNMFNSWYFTCTHVD